MNEYLDSKPRDQRQIVDAIPKSTTLTVTILTLFPNFFTAIFDYSLFKRAIEGGILQIEIVNIRDFSRNKHRKCDDIPYGGGSGMVMTPEPLTLALDQCRKPSQLRVVLSARGILLDQNLVRHLAFLYGFLPAAMTSNVCSTNMPPAWRLALGKNFYQNLLLVCGHYEGMDQRFIDHFCHLEVSIGDYILTGGETAALVLLESLARYIPGFLGNDQSLQDESHTDFLLEYPQYTRPQEIGGKCVPPVLLSGHHKRINKWRRQQQIHDTQCRRPDLWQKMRNNKNL